jgi:hypothetical protein
MAPRVRDDDGSHETVVSNLLDLQARLRGDPGSMLLPRGGRRPDLLTVEVDEVAVSTPARPSPERRIEALRRKLEFLEMEIDAYEEAAHEPAESTPVERLPEADVMGLQHDVEERLTAE